MDDILRCERERERERKTIVNSNAAVVERRHFLCCVLLCVNFYLLQIKKAENKLVVRVSVAYFIVLLRGQLQKRQSVQLDASTVIGQFGAQLAHRDASVLF